MRNQVPTRSTEALHPASEDLHALPADAAMARLLSSQQAALQSVAPAIPALSRAAEVGAAALRGGGKLGYAGAGSSGLMALADCLELPGTFGLDPARTPVLFAGGADALLRMAGHVEDDAAEALADLAREKLGHGDALIVVSASGETPYAVSIAEAARGLGVTVIGIANAPGSSLLASAEVAVLLDTGPEMVAGSTRMGAGTAQKVALNMISVMIAVQLGQVYKGRMVNLIADNAKLAARAARIVADLAQVSPEDAAAALARSGGAVKTAVLVAHGRTVAEAEADLRDSGGSLAPLLG